MPDSTVINDLKGRITVTTGELKTVFRADNYMATAGVIGCLHDIIIEARAIVDKLPKTKDGVPVVPHKDSVFLRLGVYGRTGIRTTSAWKLFDGVWHVGDSVIETKWTPVSCSYSTREAAEKAGEE